MKINAGYVIFGSLAAVFVIGALSSSNSPSPNSKSDKPTTTPAAGSKVLSKSESVTACQQAVTKNPPGEMKPTFKTSPIEPRALKDSGWSVRAPFTSTNYRGLALDFDAGCETSSEGKIEIAFVIERTGWDFLVSSKPDPGRSALLARVTISDVRRQGAYVAAISNGNDLAIKTVAIECRVSFDGGRRFETKQLMHGNLIAAGGASSLGTPWPPGADSLSCRVVDFAVIGSDERRLIEALGPQEGPRAFERLTGDALRLGVPVAGLVEPLIAAAKMVRDSK